MKSTQSSAAETDCFVTTLPSPHRGAIRDYIDELQRYRDGPARDSDCPPWQQV